MSQILIRTPDETKEFIQKKAKKIGITVNALVLQVLWEWMKKEQKENKDLKIQK